MAITRRNYTPGQYENFTNEPVGTPVLNTWYTFQLDGLFSFDVANDVILYQGGSPIPTSAYELSTDATYTAREVDFSGLTLVKMFRITNATYAGIATTASGKNFGSAVDNDLAYSLYVAALASAAAVVSRYTYTGSDTWTTETDKYSSIHVFSGLSADATFTITDGGGDERNKFTVKNADSTYKIIVTDGTYPYWVMPGQSVDFYENSGLVWASAGWERIYKDATGALTINESVFPRALTSNNVLSINERTVAGNWYNSQIDIKDISEIARQETDGASYTQWNPSPTSTITGPYAIREVKLWHEET